MSFFRPLSPLNETRVTTYESSGVFGLLLGEVVWRKQHPQAFDFKVPGVEIAAWRGS
jgi:hypothetical protein